MLFATVIYFIHMVLRAFFSFRTQLDTPNLNKQSSGTYTTFFITYAAVGIGVE